jgi:putative transposase
MPQNGHQRGHVLQLEEKIWGLGVPELRRLKQLEEENQHLKQLVADLSLDKQMLQDVLKKKF